MKSGDKVVCVKSHSMPKSGVIKNKIYTILETANCSKCLSFQIAVVIIPSDIINHCYCGYEDNVEYWWMCSSLFAPIQTKSEFISSSEFIHIEETIDVPIHEEA